MYRLSIATSTRSFVERLANLFLTNSVSFGIHMDAEYKIGIFHFVFIDYATCTYNHGIYFQWFVILFNVRKVSTRLFIVYQKRRRIEPFFYFISNNGANAASRWQSGHRRLLTATLSFMHWKRNVCWHLIVNTAASPSYNGSRQIGHIVCSYLLLLILSFS